MLIIPFMAYSVRFLLFIAWTSLCVYGYGTQDGWGTTQKQQFRYDVEVYNKHVKMTFEQNPEIVLKALIEQEQRRKIDNKIQARRRQQPPVKTQRILIDQFGHQFLWDRQQGHLPVLPLPWDYPVMWVDGPEGPMAIPLGMEHISPVFEPVFVLTPSPDACDPRKTSSIKEENKPMMSFYEPTVDPCSGKYHAEFAITATSGMADILCLLCQYLKSKRCVWQFCSHPEGVYKINISKNLTR